MVEKLHLDASEYPEAVAQADTLSRIRRTWLHDFDRLHGRRIACPDLAVHQVWQLVIVMLRAGFCDVRHHVHLRSGISVKTVNK